MNHVLTSCLFSSAGLSCSFESGTVVVHDVASRAAAAAAFAARRSLYHSLQQSRPHAFPSVYTERMDAGAENTSGCCRIRRQLEARSSNSDTSAL